MEELSEKEKSKLTKYANKYKTTEKLLIAASARKTIRYIDKIKLFNDSDKDEVLSNIEKILNNYN